MKKQAPKKETLKRENTLGLRNATKKKQVPVSKIQLSTHGPGSYQTTTFSLAYKIPSTRILGLLTPEADAQYGKLVGLQFSFREKTDDGWSLRQKIKFNKVYFKINPVNENESYFSMMELADVIQPGETFLIDENLNTQSGQIWSSLNNSFIVEDTDYAYQRLDFFPASGGIKFVFFTSSQLKSLTHFFGELIISGAQINLGRKLYHPPEKPKTFGGPRFTLKIEGAAPHPNWSNRKRRTQSILTTEAWDETTGEAALFGHPCPPVWETFHAVINEIVSDDPNNGAILMANFAKIWEDWQTWVLHISPSEYDGDYDN